MRCHKAALTSRQSETAIVIADLLYQGIGQRKSPQHVAKLLIVTLLQKIHIIENYIHSVHYVSNTEGNNSELKSLTIEEYKSAKKSHAQAANEVEMIATNE